MIYRDNAAEGQRKWRGQVLKMHEHCLWNKAATKIIWLALRCKWKAETAPARADHNHKPVMRIYPKRLSRQAA
jgi:hypothetical protein